MVLLAVAMYYGASRNTKKESVECGSVDDKKVSGNNSLVQKRIQIATFSFKPLRLLKLKRSSWFIISDGSLTLSPRTQRPSSASTISAIVTSSSSSLCSSGVGELAARALFCPRGLLAEESSEESRLEIVEAELCSGSGLELFPP